MADPEDRLARGTMSRRLLIFISFLLALCLFGLSQFVWLRPYLDGVSSWSSWTAETTATSAATTSPSSSFLTNDPLHVFWGLSGAHPGFLAELQVCLRSVLLNAPLERNLTLHLLADQEAYDALPQILHERANLTLWRTRTGVTLKTYNVEPWVANWTKAVNDLCKAQTECPGGYLYLHTVGTWFRLFAYQILSPTDVPFAVYMDVDVVVTANLEQVWTQVDNRFAFQWGAMECAGFMVLRMDQLPRVWELASHIDLRNASDTLNEKITDQLVFRAVQHKHPEIVGPLTTEWDLSVAAGAWRAHKRFAQVYPKLGMIHYNGGGSSKGPFWNNSLYFVNTSEDAQMRGGLGLTAYYIFMPWHWARSYAKSLTTPERSFPLRVLHGGMPL